MLTVITADRLISIVFTFSCRRLTLKGTYVICAAVWVIGIIIAVVPTNDLPYFYNEDRQYGFYGIFAFQVKLRTINLIFHYSRAVII